MKCERQMTGGIYGISKALSLLQEENKEDRKEEK